MNGSNVLTTGGTAVLGVVSASPRLTPLGTGMSPESALVGALRQDEVRAGWRLPVAGHALVAPEFGAPATGVPAAAGVAAGAPAIDAKFGIAAHGADAEPQRALQPTARLRNAIHPATVIESRHRSRPR
ncbi:MAG TPA: hypothetical protein VK083_13390 [Nocardia sp.]|uniref:hypothetical protein n=1 Tax=Nocardia TaxID=1817 RepID=UPI002458C31B|nr:MULTISPECIES: hypothetical protein [Nocardia]HLS77775.1 hypothetical protein [Nocardia sp.]